jgi:hypothetical protein
LVFGVSSRSTDIDATLQAAMAEPA